VGDRPAARDHRRTNERPVFESKTRQSERPTGGIKSQAATSTGTFTTQRQFHIWGRRPIENYLAGLQQDDSLDHKAHALHIIADKTGRVPAQLKNIVEPCKSLGFKITLCKSQEDEEWPLTSDEQLNHQRVCLRVPKIPTVTIHDIAQSLPDMMADTPHGCLGLVLDQVQDPRNFGAILRTAAFFGAKFVVFGEDRQAEITPLVVKTSSGGAFSLQLVPTVNINRALEILKKSGVWVVGSSLQASARHDELPLDRHYVLVVGNESKGMRQEVARHCDYLVKIPGGVASVDSLNVGVATGVLLGTLQSEMSRRSSNTFQAGELSEE
jgi:23S rRNA (guanosine2251-2'-O)-methyltransferase